MPLSWASRASFHWSASTAKTYMTATRRSHSVTDLIDVTCCRVIGDSLVNLLIIFPQRLLSQLWRPELELVGISSGSWYHCLPIRTCL